LTTIQSNENQTCQEEENVAGRFVEMNLHDSDH